MHRYRILKFFFLAALYSAVIIGVFILLLFLVLAYTHHDRTFDSLLEKLASGFIDTSDRT